MISDSNNILPPEHATLYLTYIHHLTKTKLSRKSTQQLYAPICMCPITGPSMCPITGPKIVFSSLFFCFCCCIDFVSLRVPFICLSHSNKIWNYQDCKLKADQMFFVWVHLSLTRPWPPDIPFCSYFGGESRQEFFRFWFWNLIKPSMIKSIICWYSLQR